MCGRFTLRAPASLIAEQFALFSLSPFVPRFNIAPTQSALCVRLPAEQATTARQGDWLRWGLVPSWATDPAIGNRMINARAETVTQKPAFRAAWSKRRCLIVADGFYEWQPSGGRKQPYFIRRRDDRPFAFAGLWEAWEGPDHSLLETCTILTSEANATVRPIHDRMPVIVEPHSYGLWLDCSARPSGDLAALLRPGPPGLLAAIPVGPQVNNPKHDSPQCIEPAPG